MKEKNTRPITQYETPFDIEDLEIFDVDTLHGILNHSGLGLTVKKLARSLHGVSECLVQRKVSNLLSTQHADFIDELCSQESLCG